MVGFIDNAPITLTTLTVAACNAVVAPKVGIDAFAASEVDANVCVPESKLIKSKALLVDSRDSADPTCIAVDRLVTSLELVSGV